MATTKFNGKDFLIQVETTANVYVTVGGLTANELTINNEPVETTDKDDMPWRTMANFGVRSMSVSGSGGFKTNTGLQKLHDRAMDGDECKLRLISGKADKFEGTFFVTSLTRTGEKGGYEQYQVSLESHGAVVYTP